MTFMDAVPITCYRQGCGYSPFPMERGFYNRARRTHEFWHCPAGHSQHFIGKTDEQNRIEHLEAAVAQKNDYIDDLVERVRRAERMCPWTACEFEAADRTGLRTHMRSRHGMPTLAAVAEAS